MSVWHVISGCCVPEPQPTSPAAAVGGKCCVTEGSNSAGSNGAQDHRKKTTKKIWLYKKSAHLFCVPTRLLRHACLEYVYSKKTNQFFLYVPEGNVSLACVFCAIVEGGQDEVVCRKSVFLGVTRTWKQNKRLQLH